jgi:hypothetical protein
VDNLTDFRITKLGEEDFDRNLLSPSKLSPTQSRLETVPSALQNYYSKKHLVNDDIFLTEMDLTL